MLVDLGRNDLGRVCEFGSVGVDSFMAVEHYSHVMHIVSSVSGTLREGIGPLDALRSVLPAGTLSGAPKVRAMEIIDELEPVKRGGYGGAIGYLSYAGRPRHLHPHPHRRHRWTASPTSRPAAAPWPTRSPPTSTRSPRTSHVPSRARSSWPPGSRSGHEPARPRRRQLRLLHLQPRPVPGRARGRGRGRPQRPRHASTSCSRASPIASSSRPVPCTPAEAGISVEAMRRVPGGGHPDARGLPRPPGARARRSAGAWCATSPCTARRPRSITTAPGSTPACRPDDRGALPLARRRARPPCPPCLEVTQPRRRRRDGRAPPRAARRGRAVPPGIGAHRRRKTASCRTS